MCVNKSLIIIILQVDEQVVDNAYFALIEAVCIAWFTLEYFLRLAGRSPRRVHTLRYYRNCLRNFK